ncbi:MAG: RluA family pseudouridine synthase [Candidatus Hydrothermales bacterium]
MQERIFERIVNIKSKGKRLDLYLYQSGCGISREKIKRAIEEGLVEINGKIVKKPSYRVKEGEHILIRIKEEPKKELVPEEVPFEIIYEDEYLAIINKPKGIVVHPAKGHHSGTIVHGLIFRYGELPLQDDEDEENIRAGIIHRLDKDTSGCMVVAKDKETLTKLGIMMERREIKREYRALVWGIMPQKSFEIDAPIGRDPVNRLKRKVTYENSKPAITIYEVLKEFNKICSLLKINLLTGRTHQIRVHMEYMGHPVVGDPLYSGREARKILNITGSDKKEEVKNLLTIFSSQALHAYKISFTHPITGKYIEVEADYPEEFKRGLEYLKKFEN